MTLIVALTGGIGCGKTVASDHFALLGVPVIDTDIIARQIVEPGQPTLNKLCDEFGEHILNGSGELNRQVLRTIAFSSSENKQRLDTITHPAIQDITKQKIEQVTFSYCIVVIPLLSEDSAFFEIADRIAVVVADQETKIQRVMQRSQLSRADTLAIMKSQITDAQRLQFADDVIENNKTIKDVHNNVEILHQRYIKGSN